MEAKQSKKIAKGVEETKVIDEEISNEIEVFDVSACSALILGESRTGKTTFKKVLVKINHVTELEVWRGTVTPSSSTSLFKVDGKFVSVNLLDTPGMGEASTSVSRTDDCIQNMITEFVKKDITKLNLILIAVNGSGGLTAAQVSNITNCLTFLGKQIASKTCLLVTHFENRTAEDERKWIHAFKTNPNMSFLVKACKGGFLFTGALNDEQYKNVTVRDKYITQQRRRTRELFVKLLDGEPVSLMSAQMIEAQSMFANIESVTTSCMNLRKIIPLVEQTWESALNIRVKINNAITGDKIEDPELLQQAKDVVEKMSVIGSNTDDIKSMKLDENLLDLTESYNKIGNEIRERHAKVLALLETYSELDQAGLLVLRNIEWG